MGFLELDVQSFLGFYQIIFAITVLALFGRLIMTGSGGLGLQLIVGWGALCLLLTIWGAATTISLRYPAIGFSILSLAGLFIKSQDGNWKDDLAAAGRLFALALPLIWIMADIEVSQLDVLNYMLPNMAYLFDHGTFPTALGPETFSDVPVAPYNTEFVPFLGTLAGGGFAANGLSLFTFVLHFAAALLFAQVVTKKGEKPGWLAIAFGYGMSTLINPGFVPRISFSGMGEAPLAITLLFAGWLAVTAMEEMNTRTWPKQMIPLAFTLLALINIKQQGSGIFIASFIGIVATAAVLGRHGWMRSLTVFGLAALPAIGLFLVWRGYVYYNFPMGEIRPMPLGTWVWNAAPNILKRMFQILLEKGYFTFSILASAGLLVFARNRISQCSKFILSISLITIFVFNVYLLFVYVGYFMGEHSYFRYNTELTLIIDLGIVMAIKDIGLNYGDILSRIKRPFTAALIVVMAIVPPIASKLLRLIATCRNRICNSWSITCQRN